MESEHDIYPREFIIQMTHRWPILIGWLALGFIVGWLVSLVWPAPYQARVDLAISINTDAIYTNPDDYKNSLLRQLNTFVLSDDVLETTLEELRTQDPKWSEFDVEYLRAATEPSWRDTGRWALLVQVDDATRADQIASAWRTAILNEIAVIAPHTRNLLSLDARMKDVAQSLRLFIQRESILAQVEGAFLQIGQEIGLITNEERIGHLSRWRMYALFINAADQNDVWSSLMERFPDEYAHPAEYIPWITDVLLTIEIDKYLLHDQIASLESELNDVATEQEAEFEAARGLSAHLVIEPLNGNQVTVQPLRPTAASTIIGGMVALLAWVMYFLARLFIKQGS